MIDPFSDEADPLRLDGTRAPEPEAVRQEHATLQPSRRKVVLALLAVPAAVAAAGCMHPALACRTTPGDRERCQHRFCRHHGRAVPYGSAK
jgi:hypothetical protein